MKSSNVLMSICIPTSNRPALARELLLSIIPQLNDEIEVILLENSDQPVLNKYEDLLHPNVKCYPSDRVLSMPFNWERGLPLVRGEYVTYLSDKDIVLPNMIDRFISLLRSLNYPDCLSYPKAWFDADSNTLHSYNQTDNTMVCSSFDFVHYWFDQAAHLHTAPMVYTAFYKTSMLRRNASVSPFFGFCPDVCSALFMLANTHYFHQSSRIFSVGNASSRHSVGTSMAKSGRNSYGSMAYYGADNREKLDSLMLTLPRTVVGTIISDFVRSREIFESLRACEINWTNSLKNIILEVSASDIPNEDKTAELLRLGYDSCPIPRSSLVDLLLGRDRQATRSRSDPRGSFVITAVESCSDIKEAINRLT